MAREDPLSYDPLVLWLQAEDQVLKERLNARVHDMVRDGLFEEALSLQRIEAEKRAQGVDIDTSKGIWVSIGYKETEAWTKEQATNVQPLEVAKQSSLAKSCIEAVQAGTRQYANRQERYIRVTFATSLQQAGFLDRLFLLDGSDLSKFYTHVVPQAEQLVEAFMEGKPLPDPASLSPLAQKTFGKIHDPNPDRSTRVKRHCDVCDRTTMTEYEWQEHMAGRGHKRAVQGRKKYEKMLAYFQQLAEKRDAPEVDVAS